MSCPLCGADLIRKDYPPARGYVLMAAGLGLALLRAVFDPQVLMPQLANADSQKLFLVGGLVFLYGAFHLFRHGNRFCGKCGFRFRATPYNQGSASSFADLAAKAGEQGGLAGSFSALTQRKEEGGERKRGGVRFEPVLACLKFQDARKRAEAAQTLREETGEDFGEDYEQWHAWLLEHKKIRS